MLLVRASFFCILFLFASVSSGATPIKVFLLAGQSNMTGWASTSGLSADLSQSQPAVLIRANGDVYWKNARKWLQCGPGFGHALGCFGPELTFGKSVTGPVPGKKIALIKYTVGGTELATRWRPPSSGGEVGDLYVKFIYEIGISLATLDSNYIPEIAAVLWMQGEYDAKNLSYANEYQYNLANFINDIRAKLNNPQLPFIIGMIDEQNLWPYSQIVRTAENTVAKTLSNVGIFDTRGFPTDGVHYQRDGMIRLGQSFALNYVTRFVQSVHVARAQGPALPESFRAVVCGSSIRIFLPVHQTQQSLAVTLLDLSGREIISPVNTVTCGGEFTVGLDRRNPSFPPVAPKACVLAVSFGQESWRVLGFVK